MKVREIQEVGLNKRRESLRAFQAIGGSMIDSTKAEWEKDVLK